MDASLRRFPRRARSLAWRLGPQTQTFHDSLELSQAWTVVQPSVPVTDSRSERPCRIVTAVKVLHVRTAAGKAASLRFDEAGVYLLDRSLNRDRLLRAAGGFVFAGIGLCVVGTGAGHSVSAGLGFVLSIAGIVLVVGGGLLAATGWLQAARLARAVASDSSVPTIARHTVAWARSSRQRGLVTVVVGTADGATHEFIAGGGAGVQLAREFAELLGVAESSPGSPASAEMGDRT